MTRRRTEAERNLIASVGQAVAAEVLGFKSAGSLRALTDAPRGEDGRYDLRELVPWYLARQARPAGEDELLSGPESPALERYRAARASLAELELAEREHLLVSVESAREGMSRWAVVLKRLGQRLAKRFGVEAGRAVTEALGECQRVVDDAFRIGDSSAK